MSVTMQRVTVMRPGGYKQKPYEQVVEYPAGCTLHYDTNQACLLIKQASGEPVAAFRCHAFVVEAAVEVGPATVYDPPGAEA